MIEVIARELRATCFIRGDFSDYSRSCEYMLTIGTDKTINEHIDSNSLNLVFEIKPILISFKKHQTPTMK